jgi:hypothetical protein
MPNWIFTHIASGEKRDQVTAARLKRMGVTAGFPDLMFIGPNGVVCWVELKAKGGRLSAAQAEVASHLVVCGHGYHERLSRHHRDLEALERAAGGHPRAVRLRFGRFLNFIAMAIKTVSGAFCILQPWL